MIPASAQPEQPFLARLRVLNEAALVAGIAAREADDARRRTPLVGLSADWWKSLERGMESGGQARRNGLLIVLLTLLATRGQRQATYCPVRRQPRRTARPP